MKQILILISLSILIFAQSNTDNNQMTKKENISEKEWESCLTPEEYSILRRKGTEKPFTGKYYTHDENGTYRCAACGNELFSSKTKYNSGSGWPSFYDVISEGKIRYTEDNSLGMRRIEIQCAKCDSHLGHLFDDGPNPTGKRFCVNSVSLDFEKAK